MAASFFEGLDSDIWQPDNLGYWPTTFGIRKPNLQNHGMKFCHVLHMGVSKNRDTPKWMVQNGKLIKMGWFGGTPIFGNIHINYSACIIFQPSTVQ